jgi:hypothetical protein
MITTTKKREYAQAVLAGEFKKDAYLRHINPHATDPSNAAWRLEHTQSMMAIMDEARAEHDREQAIRLTSHSALIKALRLASSLDYDYDQLSHEEARKSLAQTGRLITTATKFLAQSTSTKSTVEDDTWYGPNRNLRPTVVPDGIFL